MVNWLELLGEIKDKDICIFGLSLEGKYIKNHLDGHGLNISFVDNDKNKIGTKYEECYIYSIDYAIHNLNYFFLIPITKYSEEMREQLVNEFSVSEKRIVTISKNSIPWKKLRLEVEVAEHCNLGCNYCSHFSPLAEKKFVDMDVLYRDLYQISYLTKGDIERLFLLGGEPLLNPKLEEICCFSRKLFPNAPISIITNGILLYKQNDSLWEECKKSNIRIMISHYPIKFDYKEAALFLENKGLEVELMSEVEMFSCLPLDINGNNATESFDNCFTGTECITLYNGKLYPCAYPCNIRHINRNINNIYETSDDDGVDIYGVDSIEELLLRFTRPFNFCKYCAMKDKKNQLKWTRYDGNINQWLK